MYSVNSFKYFINTTDTLRRIIVIIKRAGIEDE